MLPTATLGSITRVTPTTAARAQADVVPYLVQLQFAPRGTMVVCRHKVAPDESDASPLLPTLPVARRPAQQLCAR